MRFYLRALATTDLAFALALALGFALALGDCAPPSIFCFLPGVGCIAVCSNAWLQFPAVFAVGAAIGHVPGVLASASVYFGQDRRRAPQTRRILLGVTVVQSAVMLVGIALVDATFAVPRLALEWTLVLSVAIVVSVNLIRLYRYTNR